MTAMTLQPKTNHPNGKRFATIEEISKASFGSVSKIGKKAGVSVLYLRRVTLKGTI